MRMNNIINKCLMYFALNFTNDHCPYFDLSLSVYLDHGRMKRNICWWLIPANLLLGS